MVSSITYNRKLGKAQTRLYPVYNKCCDAIENVQIDKNDYESIIISFIDKPLEYYDVTPNKDKVYEVDVGYDPEMTFKPADDPIFLSLIADKIDLVLDKCPIKENDKKKLKKTVLNWRIENNIGENK